MEGGQPLCCGGLFSSFDSCKVFAGAGGLWSFSSVRLRTTSLPRMLSQIHMRKNFCCCGDLHIYLGIAGEMARGYEIIMTRRENDT